MMELDDCAFPLLNEVVGTADLNEGFKGANWALLVGSVPRKAGMERADLLGINGKIFTGQGQAIARNAAKDVRVLVVGNPCNTNALIAMNNADGVPEGPLLRDDPARREPRQEPARPEGRRPPVQGHQPLHLGQPLRHPVSGFHQRENRRQARSPKSSPTTSGSRATSSPPSNSAVPPSSRPAALPPPPPPRMPRIDTVKSLITPTPAGDWHSVAVCSDGSYGIEKGLMASMPIRTLEDGKWEVVQGVPVDAFSQEKIDATISELKEERDAVKDLIPG